MADLTADEMFDRILRSLRQNNAELAREERAHRRASARKALIVVVIFTTGIAVGALLVSAIRAVS